MTKIILKCAECGKLLEHGQNLSGKLVYKPCDCICDKCNHNNPEKVKNVMDIMMNNAKLTRWIKSVEQNQKEGEIFIGTQKLQKLEQILENEKDDKKLVHNARMALVSLTRDLIVEFVNKNFHDMIKKVVDYHNKEHPWLKIGIVEVLTDRETLNTFLDNILYGLGLSERTLCPITDTGCKRLDADVVRKGIELGYKLPKDFKKFERLHKELKGPVKRTYACASCEHVYMNSCKLYKVRFHNDYFLDLRKMLKRGFFDGTSLLKCFEMIVKYCGDEKFYNLVDCFRNEMKKFAERRF